MDPRAPGHRARALIAPSPGTAPGPRGFVRDLRLRWAAEEAGLAYIVRTVSFDGRQANHLDRQPFG